MLHFRGVNMTDQSLPETASKPDTRTTNRNAWDAFVEIILMALPLLGKAAPYIVILAGAVFAVYKFHQLSQEQVRVSQDHVSAANKVLIETYEAVGKSGSGQIKNLS